MRRDLIGLPGFPTIRQCCGVALLNGGLGLEFHSEVDFREGQGCSDGGEGEFVLEAVVGVVGPFFLGRAGEGFYHDAVLGDEDVGLERFDGSVVGEFYASVPGLGA